MGYFPFFVELCDKEGLIVGGGVTALRKVEKLLPYGPRLTVAATAFHRTLEEMDCLTLLRMAFMPELLEGKAFVIAATDDRTVNHRISVLCGQKGIPVNVVDDREACTFLFPSLVKRGSLSIGISSGGASPSASIWLKERITALLPDNMEALLDYLETQRETVRAEVSEEHRRSMVYKELFAACLREQRPLSPEEMRIILQGFTEEETSCGKRRDACIW